MTIEIIIEDGTGIENANSYVTVEEATIYALNRGTVLSSNADVISALLIKATDYIETFEYDFIGEKTNSIQSLSWPRIDAYVGETLAYSETQIPKLLKNAICQAVIAQVSNIDLLPNYSATEFVKKEVVGPITTEYSDPISIGLTPKLTGVSAMLAPLIGKSPTTSFVLKTIRV
jgi:hypothetical protein